MTLSANNTAPENSLGIPYGTAIHAVLFDLDGTLLNTRPLITASFHHALQTVLGRDFSDEVILQKVGQPLETQMLDFANTPEEAKQLCAVYREHNSLIHDTGVTAFPGILDMVKALSERGLPLGVVTSKRHAMALRGLEVCGLAPYMEVTVGADDWPEHKPEPGPVEHGCLLLGMLPEEVLYVGDSPFDILAGNGAGCPTAAVTWGMADFNTLMSAKPTYVCNSPSQLC